MVEIDKLIAAVSPDVYCDPKSRKKVKELVKECNYKGAVEIAELIEATDIFDPTVTRDSSLKAPNPLDASGLKSPIEVHKLVYDSPNESLEPLYLDRKSTRLNSSHRL